MILFLQQIIVLKLLYLLSHMNIVMWVNTMLIVIQNCEPSKVVMSCLTYFHNVLLIYKQWQPKAANSGESTSR